MSRSIQAKAFTTGSDIFFRSGTYEPGSRSGQELLAHELTHVVQQGASTIRRDVVNDLRDFAHIGEQDQRERMERQPPPILQVNNIADASAANSKLSEIESYEPQMLDGGRTGTISGSQITANNEAISALSDYLVTIGEQGRTLSDFQQHARQVGLDFGRVSGQMIHLEAMGVVDRGQTAAYRAEQIVGAATGAGSMAEASSPVNSSHIAMDARNHAQAMQERLTTRGRELGQAQRSVTSSVHAANGALNNLKSGIIPREENPELAAEQRQIRSRVAAMQRRLSSTLTLVSTIARATPVGAAASSAIEAAGTAPNVASQALAVADIEVSQQSITEAIATEWYREETNAIETAITSFNSRSREAAINVQISDVRETQSRLFDAIQTFSEAAEQYSEARRAFQTAMNNFGETASSQRGLGQGYQVIANLLSDANILFVQIDTTISLGRTEVLAAEQATESRNRVVGSRNPSTGEREGGVTYYRPYQDFQLPNFGRSGGLVYRASPNTIYFITSDRIPGSAYGGQGAANPIVGEQLVELDQMKTLVGEMRQVLSGSLGMSV
jgi:hypothetical protein